MGKLDFWFSKFQSQEVKIRKSTEKEVKRSMMEHELRRRHDGGDAGLGKRAVGDLGLAKRAGGV